MCMGSLDCLLRQEAGCGLPLCQPCQGRRKRSTQELYLGNLEWRHEETLIPHAATRPLKRSFPGTSLIPQD
jgi:hypothetical protein